MWKLLFFVLLGACVGPQRKERVLFEEAEVRSSTLDGWRVLGGAHFELRETAAGVVLVGSGQDLARNSFLVSEAEWGDFELNLDVRIHDGNSGVQVRSHVDWRAAGGAGHLAGYQIEVDPSERAWSGGLYDEGRRGWLDSNEAKPEARAAFVVGEWNHYRIVCDGAHIQSWVNGVPCADFVDSGEDLTLRGHLAFQVHQGKSAHVEFRAPKLREL